MNSETAVIIFIATAAGAGLGAAAVYLSVFSYKKNDDARIVQDRENLKGQFAAVSSEVMDRATEQFLKLAESRLETQSVKAASSLDGQRRAVETSVGRLQEKLKEYETLVRAFEKDRGEKYGSLEEMMRKSSQTTERLQETTEKLNAALSNPRTRGQWGERMAEDILRAAGLLENVQYRHNRTQDTSVSRPDFTFLLPDDHKFNMDVKFPLDNYLRMVNADKDEERDRFKKDFLRDVRNRVKEITKRDYIKLDERTLDFVVLFIPNEQVYGFVLNEMPELVDEALSQKVMLTSPFSLYAVLAIVRQAHENFHFSQATRDIVRSIVLFRQAFDKFKGRFEKVGDQLQKAVKAYGEVTGPSYKMLDQAASRIEKIDEEEVEDDNSDSKRPSHGESPEV
ncbi:MAG: recombinase RmuC [Elusimicrobia bacterium]|nr:MAG: recombinase RmuC [Elusimicrobiota bacterium]